MKNKKRIKVKKEKRNKSSGKQVPGTVSAWKQSICMETKYLHGNKVSAWKQSICMETKYLHGNKGQEENNSSGNYPEQHHNLWQHGKRERGGKIIEQLIKRERRK
jgi:hypothetical protein